MQIFIYSFNVFFFSENSICIINILFPIVLSVIRILKSFSIEIAIHRFSFKTWSKIRIKIILRTLFTMPDTTYNTDKLSRQAFKDRFTVLDVFKYFYLMYFLHILKKALVTFFNLENLWKNACSKYQSIRAH